jgi:rhodanese-related sulfurtransferase
MKKYLTFFLIALSPSFLVAQQIQGKLRDAHITPKKLIKQVKKEKVYLIDVRTPEEYNAGHLANSKNIDFKSADFKAKISQLDKNKPMYLYCRTGNRSGKAVDTLKVLGFKEPYNIGGFENLKTEGLPAAGK